MITQDLIRVIRRQFALDWHGIHGALHWTRVRENGLRLAKITGAQNELQMDTTRSMDSGQLSLRSRLQAPRSTLKTMSWNCS